MKKKIIIISALVVLCFAAVGVWFLTGNKETPKTVQEAVDMPAVPEIKVYEDFEKNAPDLIDVSSTEELKKLFDNTRYDNMPRIFVRRFPDDFAKQGNPVLFAQVLLPHLLRQNELLLAERAAFLVLADKVIRGENFTQKENDFWEKLVLKYEVLNPDKAGQVDVLHNRVDRISPSLAVAQGLEATDLAKEDLDAPFDVRRWNDKKEYDFVRYPDLASAVADYALELNRGYSYLKFHIMRSEQRVSVYHPLKGKNFARGLVYYKIEDPEYVKKLEQIFDWFRFQKLDESEFEKEK